MIVKIPSTKLQLIFVQRNIVRFTWTATIRTNVHLIETEYWFKPWITSPQFYIIAPNKIYPLAHARLRTAQSKHNSQRIHLVSLKGFSHWHWYYTHLMSRWMIFHAFYPCIGWKQSENLQAGAYWYICFCDISFDCL